MSRFTRVFFALSAAVLLLATAGRTATATVLITNPGTGSLRNDHQGTVGLAFLTGPAPVTVTHLGFWDEATDGLLSSRQVGLYEVATQASVATVAIQAGTASTLLGEFRYEALGSPAMLAPNTWYALGAHYQGGGIGDTFRNNNVAPQFDVTGLNPNPTAIEGRWSSGAAISFPGEFGGTGTAYTGPNMQYTAASGGAMPPKLVGYWNFDSAATPAADQSGNSNDATMVGGAARTTATTAAGDGALQLDGASGYLSLPDMRTDFYDSATLSMWVKLNNHTPTEDSRTGLEGFGGGGAANSHYTWTNGQGYFSTFRWGSRLDGVNMTAAPDRTEWTHLAIVTEPGSGAYRVYQNGQPVGQTDPGTFVIPVTPTVGKSLENFWLDGLVDEVALRNTPQTVAQVRAEYIGGVLGASGIRALDLADIVGGGNGAGTGGDQGINPTTGAVEVAQFYGNYTGDGAYHAVPDLPFVDGVFIPNGTAPINSDGDTVVLPGTNNLSWDNIWNGPNTGVTNNSANGVDFTAAGHTEIGFHINKGITFDLDAVREAITGVDILRFMSVGADSNGTAEFRVYLDDQLVFDQAVPYAGAAVYMDIPITASDRFLTLIATNGAWAFLGDPQLLYRVPEPSAGFLAGLGALCLLGCAWRTRKRKAPHQPFE